MRRPETDIPTVLRQYQRLLDEAMTRHLPRKFTRRYLRRVFGQPRYTYDLEALERSLATPVWNLLDRGGKRWRPVLFLLILDLLGKNPRRFSDIAVIFELIHNGTLIVDDLEDGSELRRGKPTIHRTFGDDIAINAGNTLYYVPMVHVLERRDLSERIKLRIMDAYIRDLLRLHAGQGTDIVWHRGLVSPARITERQYLQMCAYKTGCLSRLAATVAAIIGDATRRQRAALAAFAETLGVVFQIQDDLLNITESPLSKNKGLGEDITEGKRSLAVLYALKSAKPRKRRRLLRILAQHTKDPRRRNEAIAIIRDTDAIPRAQRTMRRLLTGAWTHVDRAFPSSKEKDRLRALTQYLAERSI